MPLRRKRAKGGGSAACAITKTRDGRWLAPLHSTKKHALKVMDIRNHPRHHRHTHHTTNNNTANNNGLAAIDVHAGLTEVVPVESGLCSLGHPRTLVLPVSWVDGAADLLPTPLPCEFSAHFARQSSLAGATRNAAKSSNRLRGKRKGDGHKSPQAPKDNRLAVFLHLPTPSPTASTTEARPSDVPEKSSPSVAVILPGVIDAPLAYADWMKALRSNHHTLHLYKQGDDLLLPMLAITFEADTITATEGLFAAAAYTPAAFRSPSPPSPPSPPSRSPLPQQQSVSLSSPVARHSLEPVSSTPQPGPISIDTLSCIQQKEVVTQKSILASIREASRGYRQKIDEIPAINVRLQLYQRRAVHWMLMRETEPPTRPVLNPFWARYEQRHRKNSMTKTQRLGSDSNGTTISENRLNPLPVWLHRYESTATFVPPTLPIKVRGGFLADEMGLGKTLEVLALILLNPLDTAIGTPSLSMPNGGDMWPATPRPGTVSPLHVSAHADPWSKGLVPFNENTLFTSNINRAHNGTTPPRPKFVCYCGKPRDNQDAIVAETLASEQHRAHPTPVAAAPRGEAQLQQQEQGEPQAVGEEGEVDAANPVEGRPNASVAMRNREDANDLRTSLSQTVTSLCEGRNADSPHIISCIKCGSERHKACAGYDRGIEHAAQFVCAPCLVTMPPRRIKTTLIVSPQRIAQQWLDEINTKVRSGTLRTMFFRGTKGEHAMLRPAELAKYDVVVTTYQILSSDLTFKNASDSLKQKKTRRHPRKYINRPSILSLVHWHRVCLDEAQMIDSAATKAATMARELHATHRWCVTGTPMTRRVIDFLSTLPFLHISFGTPRQCQLYLCDLKQLSSNTVCDEEADLVEATRDARAASPSAPPKAKFKGSIKARPGTNLVCGSNDMEGPTHTHFSPTEEREDQHDDDDEDDEDDEDDVDKDENDGSGGFWSELARKRSKTLPPLTKGPIHSLQRILPLFCWRSELEDVESEFALPPQTQVVHRVTFSAVELFCYRRIFEKCRGTVQEVVRKLGLGRGARLSDLTAQALARIEQPIAELRLCCCYPGLMQQFRQSLPGGSPGLGLSTSQHQGPAQRGGQQQPVTLESVREKLVQSASNECTVAFQSLCSSKNALAGLHLLEGNVFEGLGYYRQVLIAYDTYEGKFQRDSFIHLHALHNFLLQCDGDGLQGVMLNLDKDTLSQKKAALTSKLSLDATARVAAKHQAMKKIGADVAMDGVLQMLFDLLHRVQHSNKNFNEAAWMDMLHMYLNHRGQSCHRKPFQSVHSISSLKKVLVDETSSLRQLRSDAHAAVVGDLAEPSSQAVQLAMQCSRCRKSMEAARAPLVGSKKRKAVAKHVCSLCKMAPLLSALEQRIFASPGKEPRRMPTSRATNRGHVLGSGLSDAHEEGSFEHAADNQRTHHMSQFHIVCSFVYNHARRQQVCEPSAAIEKHWNALRREFFALRALWTSLGDRISALDELAMCTQTLQLLPSGSPPTPGYVQNIDHERQIFLSDEIVAAQNFSRSYGRLTYLQNIAKDQNCPICWDGLGNEHSMLMCGHCFCKSCCSTLTKFNRVRVKCPVCRQESTVSAIEHIRIAGSAGKSTQKQQKQSEEHDPIDGRGSRMNTATSSAASTTETVLDEADDVASGIHIEGDYGAKITRLIQVIYSVLFMEQLPQQQNSETPSSCSSIGQERGSAPDQHHPKAIVFSQWPKMLSIISYALALNNIRSFHCTGSKFQRNLTAFKEHQGPCVVLLDLKSGGKGLNLTEAQHVFLVEPILHKGVELQAIKRVHRIGQYWPTTVHRFQVTNTIEETLEALRDATMSTSVDEASAAAKTSAKDIQVLTVETLSHLLDLNISDMTTTTTDILDEGSDGTEVVEARVTSDADGPLKKKKANTAEAEGRPAVTPAMSSHAASSQTLPPMSYQPPSDQSKTASEARPGPPSASLSQPQVGNPWLQFVRFRSSTVTLDSAYRRLLPGFARGRDLSEESMVLFHGRRVYALLVPQLQELLPDARHEG